LVPPTMRVMKVALLNPMIMSSLTDDDVCVDVHATLLYLLGIDHAQFTYKFQGLDSRLTGVEEANVRHELLS
ncbi:MAG: DUF1501 domain-containing protein, partial [Planctomycetota bacterium]